MSTELFNEHENHASRLRPLGELPALRLVEATRDVRGWEIRTQEGHLLGTVVDILVDVDTLEGRSVLVSRAGEGNHSGTAVVPLRALTPDDRMHRRLTPGGGMAPIALRYQSTTRLALWAAIVTAIVALVGWVLRAFG